jgi:hypothetical protein
MDPSHVICQLGTQAGLPPRPSPAYQVIIEGAERPWHSPTITIAQIRALARWDVRQAVVEVDLETSTETTPGTTSPITLRPGAEFARKLRFTEGLG